MKAVGLPRGDRQYQSAPPGSAAFTVGQRLAAER